MNLTPDLQARLDRLVAETGRSADEFVQDAMAGYVDELVDLRDSLDRRYDEIKTGKVEPISGEEVMVRLGAKSEARRARRP